jgi:hypothetical protein
MFCFKCGSQQADDAKFCGACGTGLARVMGAQATSPTAPAPAAGPWPGTTTPGAQPADARLAVEEWAITFSPPDSDGDVRFEAKVRGGYHGASSAHLARLSWIAFDPSGSIPLLQADNTLNQDIDDEDSVEIEAGGCGMLGEGIVPDACQVSGQVVLYPGEKQETWTIPLPESGQSGGKGPTWSNAGVETTAWRLTCSESSDDNASYTLFLLVRNTGTPPLAAITFRVRVKNRKGDVWSTEHLAAERLAAGEMRSVETSLYISEPAKARRGAVLELTAIACPLALVHSLASTVAVLKEEDAASDDDGADETGDESEDDELGASDEDGEEDAEAAESDEAAWGDGGPEIPRGQVEPPFISYQVNEETVLEASDDFKSTATDFESEVLSRINSSGEVEQFRKHMVSLAKMVVKGSYRANWVTCESEDSRIDLIFRPGHVTCVVHKYVVESD